MAWWLAGASSRGKKVPRSQRWQWHSVWVISAAELSPPRRPISYEATTSQAIRVPVHHVVHLKLTEPCVSYISIKLGRTAK